MQSRKGWRGRLTACLVLFLGQSYFAAGVSLASSLSVNPIRLDLTNAAPTAALTVTNDGVEPTLIQLELAHWAMRNGDDRYASTRDLLATPPIFNLRPGQSQIVRVGMRRPLAGPFERSYRLFLTEPPMQRRDSGEVLGLHVALRISLPVFVAPTRPARTNLRWRAVRSNDGSISIEATDTGNAHARLMDIKLFTQDGRHEWTVQDGFSYLLPGDTRRWTIGSDPALQEEPLRLRTRTDTGAVEVSLEAEAP